MEQREQNNTSRLEDPVFVESIRSQFADEWEEVITGWEEVITGKGKFGEEDFEFVDKIRRGEKVPRSNKWLYDKLVRIGQDYRLSPDEIDQLKGIFLE